MHDVQPRPVRTGSDPRSLSEFMALRDEMKKLTHPARPDVNWKLVETLSLSLFEMNGVELQTGAWYTLARSHLARVSGMNEGLNILVALLSHQWAQAWPQAVHARAEIMNGLLQRLQKFFRTWSLQSADFTALELAEKRLPELADILKRQQLSHVCNLTPLLTQTRNALSRLQNSPQEAESVQEMPVPGQARESGEESTPSASRLVYVIHKDPEVKVGVTEAPPLKPRRWPAFVAGMGTAVVLSAVTISGCHVGITGCNACAG